MSNQENIIENNSGQGKNSTVPDIVAKRFNWGAFFFNWIWGIVYQKWIMLIVLIISFIPIVSLINLGLVIYFGTQGNKWAWQARLYKSIEEFHKIQRNWAAAGVGLFVFFFAIGVIAALTLPALMGSTQGAQYKAMFKKAASTLNLTQALNANENINVKDYLGSADELIDKYFIPRLNIKMKAPGGFVTNDNIQYQFTGLNSDCSDTVPCAKILVDVNAEKPPNEFTKDANNPKDRFVLYLYESSVAPEPNSVEYQILNRNRD